MVPYGGNVTALAIDPVNHLTMYAGTEQGRIFKSTNGATSWAAVDREFAGKGRVAFLAIDPVNQF